jgi:4'-phosphopantetheinyl transferase
LSRAEQERAERFRLERSRRQYVISHGFLRDVLARYLQTDPAALVFETGPHGKPFVAGSEIQFNLSHSGDLAVCAVTRGRSIGVDVEKVRPVKELEAIVSRFFTPSEGARWAAATNHERAFFECWTQKEAYVKGLGGGLSIPLHSFDTSSVLPGWTLVPLPFWDGFLGALAIEGEIERLQIWRWPGPQCALTLFTPDPKPFRG